jgi:hypothetical protein
MPQAFDFRTIPFDPARVDTSGKDVGRRVYWKLYATENLLRVIIHSVLKAQIGADWWQAAVASDIQREAQRQRTRFARRPWHGSAGSHDIYFTTLFQLNEILRANSNLFLPVIADVDAWIAKIEQIRLPRNIVGHMNWPSTTDRQRVDVIHADIHALATYLSQSGLPLSAP